MHLKIILIVLLIPFSISIFCQKDNSEEKPKSSSILKEYEDVITHEAITDTGLISVHQIFDKYFLEIPDDLLDKEILVVSRISGFVRDLNFGGAGMKSRPQQVIRFEKKGEQILMRSVSFSSVASENDPIYNSVRNNNFEPVIMTFPIKTRGKNDNYSVIQINKLFETDVAMIGALRDSERKIFGIKGLDNDRSFIEHIKSYDNNLEVRHVLTYKGDKLPDNQLTQSLSLEMNQSFIPLPEERMTPRYYDHRVGYFSLIQNDFSSAEQRAVENRFITRWKLIPKDIEAYKRGELVEPIKPIVYYIDPATPLKWRKYIKQGVDDWQVAFEAAGFKNAIYALDPPMEEDNPEWSPEDARYSVIRYVSTDIQNAMGPHVHDPRTGEILEADIIWYHNVINLLRNWFMVQTAAVNPEARGVNFKEEVMGQLIRFVSAHEVGHTLGLPHNFGSSVAYSVDSLRSPTFTATHGTAPSIMDYARFNYIAQPEDSVTNLSPRIGEYDIWSIQYGYTYFPDANSLEEEKELLHKMAMQRSNDPVYRYGRQTFNPIDPTSQSEDLSDDAVRASELGIRNLQRIIPELREWSMRPGEDYSQLEEMYSQVFSQYNRYMGHVVRNVGGIYNYSKKSDEDGEVYSFVPKDKQVKAIQFLNDNLFKTPQWMIQKDILSRVDMNTAFRRIRSIQDRAISMLLNEDRLKRMEGNVLFNGNSAYKVSNLVNDLVLGIFHSSITDPISRELQRNFIDKLAEKLKEESNSDIKAVSLHALKNIEKRISKFKSKGVNKYHFDELVNRIQRTLNEE